MRRHVRNAWLISAAALFVLLAGCNEQPVKLKGNFSVEKARAFDRFPVYYAGGRVAGLPLTSVNRDPVTAPPGTPVARKLRAAERLSSIDFTYGSCTIPAGAESCGLPLAIQIWPACARYPGLYEGPGSPTPRKTRIRGVPAAYFEGGYRLEIQTGASTIVIFGRQDRLRAAVDALEGLNIPVRPSERLPVPARGALDGTLPC